MPPLDGAGAADLLVVGGGYSGLWAALLARQADPGREVLLVEAGTCGWAASGRNGGFCAASLTHGLANGARRFPEEIDELEWLGRANLAAIGTTVAEHRIDCDFERTGELAVAVEPYLLAGLAENAALARRYGQDVTLLDREEVRAEVNSPKWSMSEYGHQAVVWQTAVNPVVALELLATGAWSGAGVLGPEALPPRPFLDLLAGYGSPWGMEERSTGGTA
ncbi:FAD-dependent oxidoreductase [Micromonospora sp. LOL_024]|uniref:FAD-dependent oxidoreductase n=1 Tax=Micromonospora sp. LOL_024 TaxID=3345412 RepID=UPI003A88A499